MEQAVSDFLIEQGLYVLLQRHLWTLSWERRSVLDCQKSKQQHVSSMWVLHILSIFLFGEFQSFKHPTINVPNDSCVLYDSKVTLLVHV